MIRRIIKFSKLNKEQKTEFDTTETAMDQLVDEVVDKAVQECDDVIDQAAEKIAEMLSIQYFLNKVWLFFVVYDILN